jgi:hypothetical protein
MALQEQLVESICSVEFRLAKVVITRSRVIKPSGSMHVNDASRIVNEGIPPNTKRDSRLALEMYAQAESCAKHAIPNQGNGNTDICSKLAVRTSRPTLKGRWLRVCPLESMLKAIESRTHKRNHAIDLHTSPVATIANNKFCGHCWACFASAILTSRTF